MFSRTFVRTSNNEGLRRRMRQERNEERRIALQHRWYVGGLATLVASSLVFSGMSPASAEEVTPTDPAVTTTEATATDPATTDAEAPPPAEEPVVEEPKVEEPVAPEATAPEEQVAESDVPAEADTPVLNQSFSTLAAPTAAEDVAALACTPLFYGFEIDGDRPANCGGNDWGSVPDSTTNAHGPYKTDNDKSDPATWYAAGNPAQHSTILNGQAWSTMVNGDPILFAAWDRASGTGSSGFIIEITKAPTRSGGIGNVPQPDRSLGGTVFFLDQSGNDGTILRGVCTYTSTANYPGTCVTSNFPANSFMGVTSEDGTFVEVGLNLALLANVKPGCPPTIGSAVYIRSFTGNNNELGGNIQAWAGPLTITPPSTCGTLTIVKKNEAGTGLEGATFRITPSPISNDAFLDVQSGAGGSVTVPNAKPGSYSVKETVAPAGYLLPTPDTQPASIATGQTTTLTFVDPLGSATWLKKDAAGNLLGGATFQLSATGGAAAAAPWASTFPKTVVDNGTNDADPVAGQIKVVNLPTGSYSVAETAAPAGYVLDGTPKTFTISQQTPNASIATAFVNIPYATVTLTKVWVDSFPGDRADISIGGTATANGTSTAPTNGPVIQVSVAPGSPLTLAEALPDANTGEYSSTLACVGATVSNNTGTGGSITVPAYPASANGVQCTFTNTAIKKTVKLQKEWIDAIEGDTAQLTVGGNSKTSTADGSAEQLDTVNVAEATVRVGDTVNLSEVLAGVGTYGSTYECTAGQTTGTGTGTSFTLTVPNANVTCTFTNTADRGTVTLNKQWVNAFADDEADLSITGAGTDAATSVATGGNSTDNTNVASVEVRVGEKVTLSESLPGANTGEYTSTWFCSNGTQGAGGSIPEITVVGDLDCTIVNTAREITVRVDKRWIDAFQGDDATLYINGDNDVSTATGVVNQLDEDVVVKTVRIGDVVNVSETLAGDNVGTYLSGYACSVVQDGVGSGTSFQFTAPDSDVTCTFTNAAKKVQVTLQKRWINSLEGSSTLLSLNTLTRTSLANGDPGEYEDPVKLTLEVRVGAILPFKEELNNVGVYSSNYLCLGGGVVSGNGQGREFTLKVTDGNTACFFVNRALTSDVTVVKTWVNGQEGDTADLSITGADADAEGTSTSNGDVGEWTDTENAVTDQATIGGTVTVTEVIDTLAGDPSDYASSLVCTDTTGTLVDVDARTGSFTMPNGAVQCEFTNTAERPTLSLVKVVNGAPVADTNWQLFGTPEDGDVVTNPAGGDVAPTPVLPGLPHELTEEVIGDAVGLDEFEAEEWSCVSDDAGTITLTDSEPGSATLRGLDKGEHVVCTIINSHIDQGFTVEKDAVDSVQNEDGSWTVTYEITVHNNSVVVPITYDLVDTLDTPAAGVTYTGASWTGPTSGSWTLPSLSAQLADDQVAPPNNGSNDPVYTVEVDVEVAAMPAQPGPCASAEGEGIGIVNTAYLTVGEVTEDDSACGTVHFDDVDIEKTATDLPEGGSVEPGDTFDYVLTVTNNGTREAVDVVVTDAVPDRLEVTNIDLPAGWSNDNAPDLVDGDNVLQVSTPTLAKGASAAITVTVEFLPAEVPPVEPGDGSEEPPVPLEELVNTACVAAERDQVEENNCDTVDIPVREITAVVYTKCVADAPFLGWTITKSAALLNEEIDFLWTPDSGTETTDPAEVAITQPGGTATWSAEIEWPGAAFTPSGVSIDYPGWRPIVLSDVVPGSIPTQYYYPGTTDIISPEDQPDYIFNGLILDDRELDYAWRLGSTITFTVNPELVFQTEYPVATPECFVARHSDVQIEKTASVEKTEAGKSFTYTLAVENMSDDAAAESVVITDAIPADIKITDVSWPGEGDDTVFPNWQSCEVTGQNSAGYGGNLECVLYGPLQPQGANEMPSAAPTITLAATVNPSSTSTSITNVAVVDYHTFGDPDDPGRDSDDAVVQLTSVPPLPATGGQLPPLLVILGLLALLGGATMLVVTRRRRGEVKPTL
ncbi:SpaA isopeptide-forming pilin-related protein [Microbacterium hibisci]|uniref:SpaA isopeptide-forming pilin-related protein n=1 Tax=Microbacterium hibisci TaxID=2036000 RepID=UPI001941A2F4|nr:SpaA isopeptide-forming pilin-related protein [Microbacterium hibisci]